VATQKRVVKIEEEKSFRPREKILENPKRLFKIFGNFQKFSPKKKSLPKWPCECLSKICKGIHQRHHKIMRHGRWFK
jgi:hypothetical protein